ncbi:Palmitoleoyl-protein carboxylesterase NOTUM [Armadillidium vulgare]|nr:Palmitoleoyl-protein carboxylesterase NOTUM [Armadillidium vulgare]
MDIKREEEFKVELAESSEDVKKINIHLKQLAAFEQIQERNCYGSIDMKSEIEVKKEEPFPIEEEEAANGSIDVKSEIEVYEEPLDIVEEETSNDEHFDKVCGLDQNQWVFDEAQMQMDNVGKPVSKQQWNYIHSNGERIKRSLNSLSAVFAPSCISHTSLTSRHWSSVKVNGVSLSDALNCWSKLKGENNSTLLKRQKAELSNGIQNMLILSSNRKSNNNSSIELSRIVKRPKKTRRRINKTRHSRNKQNRGRKSKRRKKGGRNATNLDYFQTSENVMTPLNSTIGNMLSDSPGLTDPKATKPFESVPVGLQERASSSNLLKQRKRERRRKRRKQKKKERKRKRKHRKKEKRKKNRKEERRNKKRKIDSVADYDVL